MPGVELLNRFWTPLTNSANLRPIQPFEKRGELGRRQTHHPVLYARPAEFAVFETLINQNQTRAVPDQNFDPVRAFRPENEGCAAERIKLERLKNNRCKAIDPFAEINRPRGDIDPRRNRAENHLRLFDKPPIASTTAKMTSRGAFVGIRSFAPSISISMIEDGKA